MASTNQFPETRSSLILRLRDSADIVAWQEFVEIYHPLIRSLAIRYGLQSADSDDVTQEVLTRVAKNVENWSDDVENSSFRGWLATITRNQTIEFFRACKRQPISGAELEFNGLQSVMPENDFDLEHARQIFAWAARRVQSRFAEKTWQAFWLTAVEGLSAIKCSEQLKTSVAQIYVSRSRVMSAIKLTVEKSRFALNNEWRLS